LVAPFASAAPAATFAALNPPTVATTVELWVPVTSPDSDPVKLAALPLTLPVTLPVKLPLKWLLAVIVVPEIVPPLLRLPLLRFSDVAVALPTLSAPEVVIEPEPRPMLPVKLAAGRLVNPEPEPVNEVAVTAPPAVMRTVFTEELLTVSTLSADVESVSISDLLETMPVVLIAPPPLAASVVPTTVPLEVMPPEESVPPNVTSPVTPNVPPTVASRETVKSSTETVPLAVILPTELILPLLRLSEVPEMEPPVIAPLATFKELPLSAPAEIDPEVVTVPLPRLILPVKLPAGMLVKPEAEPLNETAVIKPAWEIVAVFTVPLLTASAMSLVVESVNVNVLLVIAPVVLIVPPPLAVRAVPEIVPLEVILPTELIVPLLRLNEVPEIDPAVKEPELTLRDEPIRAPLAEICPDPLPSAPDTLNPPPLILPVPTFKEVPVIDPAVIDPVPRFNAEPLIDPLPALNEVPVIGPALIDPLPKLMLPVKLPAGTPTPDGSVPVTNWLGETVTPELSGPVPSPLGEMPLKPEPLPLKLAALILPDAVRSPVTDTSLLPSEFGLLTLLVIVGTVSVPPIDSLPEMELEPLMVNALIVVAPPLIAPEPTLSEAPESEPAVRDPEPNDRLPLAMFAGLRPVKFAPLPLNVAALTLPATVRLPPLNLATFAESTPSGKLAVPVNCAAGTLSPEGSVPVKFAAFRPVRLNPLPLKLWAAIAPRKV